jgi:hypothetical protein
LFINEYRKADVSLAFDVPFDWNVQSMSRFFAKWVVDNDQAQELSVVGIMSTTNFASILSTLVGTRVSELSKAFIYSVSCLRNVDLPPQAARYVLAVANCVGAEVIRELDALVSVRNLAKLSQPKLFGLFALLLATIIAVQYSDERVSENVRYFPSYPFSQLY